ncbi:hypothetical protein CK203_093674 [Vitis vinifera]|uniref:Reverse transcriptase/retrotransposon-derived protein RNase H-like domain-containing protein n=1 Tax=Vitis vinifera TaxID=29760 RepID=A0A438CIF0_VITVI|nr:hypothetical protein CK203_093674 [Vitis vinifera]
MSILEHMPAEECLLVYAMHLQHSNDQGSVLGHIIFEKGIEVDKAKVELIVKLPSPTTIKGDAKFVWDERCQRSFEQLKQFLTTAPIVMAPN